MRAFISTKSHYVRIDVTNGHWMSSGWPSGARNEGSDRGGIDVVILINMGWNRDR